MTNRIEAGLPARRIEITGKPARRIDPAEVAKALGASKVVHVGRIDGPIYACSIRKNQANEVKGWTELAIRPLAS
jgi:hypothetical protein